MDYELYHHGVLGQKWGIRRYQPYPKGERVKGGKEIGEAKRVKRKDKIPKSVEKASRKVEAVVSRRQAKKEAQVVKREQAAINKKEEPVRKKLSEMTEEEIQSEIKRMQLQKQYTDLFKSLYPQPKPTETGKSAVKKIMGDIMTNAVKDVGKQVVKYVLGTTINKATGKKIVKVSDDKKKQKKDDDDD